MDITRYLQRIGLKEIEDANYDTLLQLQLQHMLHVPFENLNVMYNIPIPLDVENYYKKIVLEQRGGFCYELNGLFNSLLKNLDFNTYFISATVKRPDGTWAKPGLHASLIVELDQPYLVDVGFGDSTRMPLPLTGEIREDVSGVYRVAKVKEKIFDLQRKESDHRWRTLFRADITPRELTDFKEACHFNQNSPESHFTQKEIVSLATLNGRITLSGDTLITTEEGEVQKIAVDEDDQSSILDECFGIKLEQLL
ncbi:arylamine N-acetyltransferase [Salinicoccus jeotgali]|uniref:Arylamine N-acetyltransferase n=1 Tax=Salinicoccus jeotgali TaxID=381634 RepID=A0ABP7F8W2_9STAP